MGPDGAPTGESASGRREAGSGSKAGGRPARRVLRPLYEDRGALPDGEPWFDVAMLHDPDAPDEHALEEAARTFDRGVGRVGYERGTGVRVPMDPGLRLPGDKTPIARPFDAKGDHDTDG